MQYREFGKTGLKVSALGLGAMRLPSIFSAIVEDEAIPIIQRAIDLGVNFIDTSLTYGESEIVVGKAIKKYRRDKLVLNTKNPIWDADYTGAMWRKKLELSLKRMQVDYFDTYAVWHGMAMSGYEESMKVKDNWFKEAMKAKKEGLFRHMIFSSHDTPDNIIKFFKMGYFEGVILQYNLLDRVNEKVIDHAYKNGMGIGVMGTVGGGRLGAPSKEIQKLIPGGSKSSAETAIRFVLSNPGVSCALSGMGTIKMVEENCAVASRQDQLSPDELKNIQAVMNETKKLADLYCTGCNYCMPCPNGVNIPHNFAVMNNFRLYGLKEFAIQEYRDLVNKKMSADLCRECGKCAEKCPQKIKIIEQLKEVSEKLSEQKEQENKLISQQVDKLTRR